MVGNRCGDYLPVTYRYRVTNLFSNKESKLKEKLSWLLMGTNKTAHTWEKV
jgi:hypothetical protein